MASVLIIPCRPGHAFLSSSSPHPTVFTRWEPGVPCLPHVPPASPSHYPACVLGPSPSLLQHLMLLIPTGPFHHAPCPRSQGREPKVRGPWTPQWVKTRKESDVQRRKGKVQGRSSRKKIHWDRGLAPQHPWTVNRCAEGEALGRKKGGLLQVRYELSGSAFPSPDQKPQASNLLSLQDTQGIRGPSDTFLLLWAMPSVNILHGCEF